jgi:glycosyltransferase involved in cell wall biosynthesis
VVAGATGGVPAVVADNEASLLVPVGDPAAFAASVCRLLDDPRRRRAMGRAARERVLGHHDLAQAAARIGHHLAALTTRVPS